MSEPKRFFIDKLDGGIAVLTGDEFEHAKNVLRIGVEDEIVLLDNSGTEYTAIVDGVDKKSLTSHVVRSETGKREASTNVCLLFGYLKNADKNEFTVQKAVELGVNKIVCFSSEYSSAYMNENKLERLNKVAKESAKQCLRSVAPSVSYLGLEEALEQNKGYTNKLFACEFIKDSDVDLTTLSGDTVLVVGSEGGFSEKEWETATKLGYKTVSLGKRILRAETASVALTSVVMFALGELGAKK